MAWNDITRWYNIYIILYCIILCIVHSTFHIAPSRLFRHQPPWCARWGLLCNTFCRWCATHVPLAAWLEVVDNMQMSTELIMNVECGKLVTLLNCGWCHSSQMSSVGVFGTGVTWVWSTASSTADSLMMGYILSVGQRWGWPDGVKWSDSALGGCVRQISWSSGHLAVVPWNVHSVQSLAAASTNSSSTWVEVSCDFECGLTW